MALRDLWRRLFGDGATPDAREIAHLRLRIQELEAQLEQARRHAEYARQTEHARAAAAADATLETLLTELATPLSHLHAQLHLAEQGALPPDAPLKTARHLFRALEAWQVHMEGTVGAVEPYDPERHMPLRADAEPHAGQPVIVRLAGVVYKGKRLRKAGVEAHDGGTHRA
jgi:molecular chaperone GrpE (heat shock protein)